MFYYAKSLEHEPSTHLPIHSYKAELYLTMGQYNAALGEAIQATQLNQRQFNNFIYTILSRAYLLLGRPAQAIATVNFALRRHLVTDNWTAPLYAVRGLAYLKQGNFTASRANLRLGRQVDPNAFDVLFLEAMLAHSNGNLNLAVNRLNHLLNRAQGNYPVALRKRALFEAERGNLVAAKRDINDFINQAPATSHFFNDEFYTIKTMLKELF
jgi:tetratricopeptide (TPR) repeat protein